MAKGRTTPADPMVSQQAGSFNGDSVTSTVCFLVEGAVDHIHAIDAVLRTIQGQEGDLHNNADTVPNYRNYFNAKGDPCRLSDINYSRWGQIAEITFEEVYSPNSNFGNQANAATQIFGDPGAHYRVKVQFDATRPVVPKVDWNIANKAITVYNSESTAAEFDATGTSRTPEFNTQIGVEADMQTRRVKGASRIYPDGKFNIRWEIRVPTCKHQDQLRIESASAGTGPARDPDEIPFWWTINNPMIGYYSQACHMMVGTVNSQSFLGFNRGQILYLGCSFRQVNAFFDWWEVTHQFDFKPNREFIDFGDYTVAEDEMPDGGLEGHQYVWVQRGTRPGAGNKFNPKIRSCTIENIYPHDDHNCLFRKIVGSTVEDMPDLPTDEGEATLNPANIFKYGDPVVTRSPELEWEGEFPDVDTGAP